MLLEPSNSPRRWLILCIEEILSRRAPLCKKLSLLLCFLEGALFFTTSSCGKCDVSVLSVLQGKHLMRGRSDRHDLKPF